jgi:hypothetical protein
MHPVTELARYFLTSLFAAALLLAGFPYIQGYTLDRLSRLRWQLTRATTTWAMTVCVLLLLAFEGGLLLRFLTKRRRLFYWPEWPGSPGRVRSDELLR